MIFVSTGGQRNVTAAKTAIDFYNHGILGVELSGGAYAKDYEQDLASLPAQIKLQIHNYFPPPQSPFVLNLASNDEVIANRSLLHVRSAMRLGILLGCPRYSFHAGFRINPHVSELGKKLGKHNLQDRKVAYELFGDRVLMLAEEARQEGITLFIENNVINPANLLFYGEDPLLLTHPDEISRFMENMPSNVHLLLDVAHLKVSANALGFDLLDAHETLRRWIRGYHLSDNDGTSDSNDEVSDHCWFWQVLIPNLGYYTLEIYKTPTYKLAEQYEYVSAKIGQLSRK